MGTKKPGNNVGADSAQRKPLPIGIEFFVEMCDEGYYYVDKTLLIRDLLDNSSEVTLFTRPRRFGKSLNLDMLHTFFEISDTDTSRYFVDKKIWQCGPKYTNMQGKYPVIRVSFAGVEGSNWNELLSAVQWSLQQEYQRHMDRLDRNVIGDDTWSKMHDFVDRTRDEEETRRSLKELSRILHNHYRVAPIILIDEYDTPLETAWNIRCYDEMAQLMRSMLTTALKGNPYLSFACMTGVLRVAKEGIFSGLNHLFVDDVLSTEFDEYFGFTPDEVGDLAEAYGVRDKYPEIQKWYQGYCFGMQPVFNPWSVLYYISKSCKPAPYWGNTASNRAVSRALEYADVSILEGMATLLNGKPIWGVIEESLVYPDIEVTARDNGGRAIYTLLLMSGYLTTTGRIRDAYADGDTERKSETPPEHELTIPNLELRRVFRYEILVRMTQAFGTNSRRKARHALRTGDPAAVEAALREALGSVSVFDLTSKRDYHLWLLGLLDFLFGCQALSKHESWTGRYDLWFEPLKPGLPGVILELRYGKELTDEQLDSLAGEALEQILHKDYATELRHKGVRDILVYEIACSGKNVRIKSDKFE